MTALALHRGHVEEKARRYLDELNRTINLFQASKLYLKALSNTLFLLRNSNSLRAEIRQTLQDCNATCEDPAKCAEILCSFAKSIRDGFFELVSMTEQSVILKPFSRLLLGPVTDWDDFVEDCTLASDDEFRKLIGQIADAA
jgi:hypothetical protein